MNVTVTPDGRVRLVYDEALAPFCNLGAAEIRRASHIEPVNWPLRWLFHAIRCRVADDSRLAAWTRTWPCRWRARIFGGPVLGPFSVRSDALAAERQWLVAAGF